MESSSIQSRPSSPSQRICKYDVFLSFRGEDTRNTFTDHLYASLMRKGIFAFKDDRELRKGRSLSRQLPQSIKDSRTSIVVFSKDYAASTWCLEEMATIVECAKELEQAVFSVFYDVDPSHVRNQVGDYKKAFDRHTARFKNDPGKVLRWKSAMTSLADSVGFDVRDKSEVKEIEKIVQNVIKELDYKFSGFLIDLVGIQSPVKKLENFLQLSSKNDHFRVLGIWGMGGIGKSTHARVLYNKISCQFEACCFIEDMSKTYKEGGAVAIEKQIIRQTLYEKNLELCDRFEMGAIVENRLPRKKVLMVLDNVDELEQLEELAVNPELLGPGSRMIITTRIKHILEAYGADEVYRVPLLTNEEAHELFYRKAFKTDHPNRGYEDLIPKVLKYADGLPLAIRALGSFLHSLTPARWEAAWEKWQSYPQENIMRVLQKSFEKLDLLEKEIFLDSACFFTGKNEDYVKRILCCCELFPNDGIPDMVDKSLVTIENRNIQMHNLLQVLGRKLVRGEFPRNPEKWNRLWLYKDFHLAMTAEPEIEPGRICVEALVLDQGDEIFEWGPLKAENFSKMKDLRLLILYHKNFSGNLNFLSNKLRYLSWYGYPFTSLPSSFGPNGLVELNMPGGSIKWLWEGIKQPPILCSLEVLDLRDCTKLERRPDTRRMPNLEQLRLEGCINLSEGLNSFELVLNTNIRNAAELYITNEDRI